MREAIEGAPVAAAKDTLLPIFAFPPRSEAPDTQLAKIKALGDVDRALKKASGSASASVTSLSLASRGRPNLTALARAAAMHQA